MVIYKFKLIPEENHAVNSQKILEGPILLI